MMTIPTPFLTFIALAFFNLGRGFVIVHGLLSCRGVIPVVLEEVHNLYSHFHPTFLTHVPIIHIYHILFNTKG